MTPFRQLTHKNRTRRANRQLGGLLAFVAGAVNAGGFMAIQRYTSHMTGIVSEIADNLVLGSFQVAAAGLAALLAFVAGAASTSVTVNWARRRQMHSEYAFSLMLEAVLLLLFGLLGSNLNLLIEVFMPTTVLVLSFIMGLQNAIVTKISKAEIRTTHMTGVITDLGIELGRLLYWNRTKEANAAHYVSADRDKLVIHSMVLGLFFGGAVVGAMAFKSFGFVATVPLSLVLVGVSMPPIARDMALYLRYRSRSAKA